LVVGRAGQDREAYNAIERASLKLEVDDEAGRFIGKSDKR
jgi:hypothetical protein